jgi:hypothetical protein
MDILRIKFVIPKHYSFELGTKPEININIKDQYLRFSVRTQETSMYRSYTLESETLDFTIDQAMLTKIKETMYLISIELDKGILINPALKTFSLGSDFQNQLTERSGVPVKVDEIGVSIVKKGTKFLNSDAKASVKTKLTSFECLFNKYFNLVYKNDPKILAAIELYNSSNYLTIINQASIFMLYMSAIECLIDQEKVSKASLEIINKTQSELSSSEIDAIEKNSLIGSLEFIKRESIKRAGSKLVDKLLNPFDRYCSLSPVDFFNKAYDLRSKFVHEGASKTKHLDIRHNEMQRFCKDIITNYFIKICCIHGQ